MINTAELLSSIGLRIGKPPGWERIVQMFASPEQCRGMGSAVLFASTIRGAVTPDVTSLRRTSSSHGVAQARSGQFIDRSGAVAGMVRVLRRSKSRATCPILVTDRTSLHSRPGIIRCGMTWLTVRMPTQTFAHQSNVVPQHVKHARIGNRYSQMICPLFKSLKLRGHFVDAIFNAEAFQLVFQKPQLTV